MKKKWLIYLFYFAWCLAAERKKDEAPTWALSKFLKEISQAKENMDVKPAGMYTTSGNIYS